MRPRTVVASAVVAAGLLVAGVGAALALTHRGPAVARAVPVVNVGTVPAPTTPTAPRSPAGPTASSPSAAGHRPSGVVAGQPVSLAHGARLVVPRLRTDAPIVAVHPSGNVMGVPRDPRTIGWWSGGSVPGDPQGTTVLVGHVNYAGVTGALGSLPQARPGDLTVVRTVGHRWRYRIVAVRTYPKTAGIPAAAFDTHGAPRLVLITCGGPFDAGSGNYLDNIVAYAVPA